MEFKSNGKVSGELAKVDPKGLIYESYRIEGITGFECRTIFLDWALGWPVDSDPKPRVKALLDHYAPDAPDHPMTQVLNDALEQAPKPTRRGGRSGRMAAKGGEAP